ncbi:MAG: AMP-binding protein [Desulfuromonadales bacterium]|nr:AMP-binding protein [Desulfuromonadales bacterium]
MLTIDSLLAESCRRHGAKAALRQKTPQGWLEISYTELWTRCDQVAAGLRQWGLRPGDRAALLASSSPMWVIAYLGILKAGGVAVPVDKELKSGELRHILADCQARLLFTDPPFLESLADIAEELPELEKIVLLRETTEPGAEARLLVAVEMLATEWRRVANNFSLPAEETGRLQQITDNLRTLVQQQPKEENATESNPLLWEEVRRRQALKNRGIVSMTGFAGQAPAPPGGHTPQDTAVILYTSGTTGRSKGAMLSHANIVSNLLGVAQRFRIDESIHTLSFLPINHVYEQVCGILLPLSVGGAISFAESIKKLSANLAEVRPSFLLGVPAVFRLLYDRLRRNIEEKRVAAALFSFPLTRPLVLRRIRQSLGNLTLVSGGAALDPEVAAGLRKMGLDIFQGYGITETSPVIAFECPGETRLGSVGRPLPGVEVLIDHPNDEGIGEILVRGPNIMQGYYNNPPASAEALLDGWYHTGDLGRLDADGYLYICGRVKNLIVTPNGKNVYPEEVEIELLKSPFIAEAMVYGHQVSPTAEEVHAILYPDQEALDAYAREKGMVPLREMEVENLIRREVLDAGKRLADYKRVKRFTLREDEFPKTTTRKIKRYAVEAAISADRA